MKSSISFGSRGVLNDTQVIVVGSQAILGVASDDALSPEVTTSVETDIAPFHDPDEREADLIDGSIGEGSLFYDNFHIYAQGVSRHTSRLPSGWESRLIPWAIEGTMGVTAWFLDPYDLLIAKYFANRPKDHDFCQTMALLDMSRLLDRLKEVESIQDERRQISQRIHRHFDLE